MKKLTGSIVALVTPFHEDGSVDFARLRELCDWHIANGTDAILALGTTGETASTSLEEDIKTLECVIDHVNGRVPVIAGAGSNSSEMQKHKSVIYSQMGASALLCISPYYVKTNEEGMYRHFMMSADAATAPIILYNVPGRTGCKISPDVVRRLSVHPNVMAIKEASGDIGYAMKVARYLSDDFTMYSGNDDITIPLMSLGASGVISVWANVMPRTVHDMVTDYLAGRHEKAIFCFSRKAWLKVREFQRRSLGRASQSSKHFYLTADQEGRQNSPVGCSAVGSPLDRVSLKGRAF